LKRRRSRTAKKPKARRAPRGAGKPLHDAWEKALASLRVLQARVLRERETVARAAEDAVQRALAALNIPSRQEVQELSRKVDELSRRIEAFRR
jgi:hypothetical protein